MSHPHFNCQVIFIEILVDEEEQDVKVNNSESRNLKKDFFMFSVKFRKYFFTWKVLQFFIEASHEINGPYAHRPGGHFHDRYIESDREV